MFDWLFHLIFIFETQEVRVVNHEICVQHVNITTITSKEEKKKSLNEVIRLIGWNNNQGTKIISIDYTKYNYFFLH